MGLQEEKDDMFNWYEKRQELERAICDHKYPELPEARKVAEKIVREIVPDAEIVIEDHLDPEIIYYRTIHIAIYTELVPEKRMHMLARVPIHERLYAELGQLSREFTISFYDRDSK